MAGDQPLRQGLFDEAAVPGANMEMLQYFGVGIAIDISVQIEGDGRLRTGAVFSLIPEPMKPRIDLNIADRNLPAH